LEKKKLWPCLTWEREKNGPDKNQLGWQGLGPEPARGVPSQKEGGDMKKKDCLVSVETHRCVVVKKKLAVGHSGRQ